MQGSGFRVQGVPGILPKDDLKLDDLGGEPRREHTERRSTPGTAPGVGFGVWDLGSGFLDKGMGATV